VIGAGGKRAKSEDGCESARSVDDVERVEAQAAVVGSRDERSADRKWDEERTESDEWRDESVDWFFKLCK
jgi:hypothetical protein